MSAAESKPEAIQPTANDDATPDELDEPNEATVIRKPVSSTAPEAVESEPNAAQTSLSLPRISAYGDDNVPGPASSASNDEPTERTSRRQAPSVEEKLDTDDEPDGTTAVRPAYAPPTAPPPTTPPLAHEPAAAEQAVIPDPEPSPVPDPSPIPEPTPVPEPEPVPDPTPEPGPLPGPEPVPEPEPVSEVTVEAAYQPFVQPSGMLVQESRNGQVRHWAPPQEQETAAEIYEPEPAYATAYAEDAYATEEAGDWQTGYVSEQEPIEQDFGDYGAQQKYVSSLMASESEDNPSTWIVLLWVGAIFMIVMLVLGIWLMTL